MQQHDCSITKAIEILEGKWTLMILNELSQKTCRFGQIRSALEGISPKTLTERLKFLEARGIIERTIFPEIPPRVEYNLTPIGLKAKEVVKALSDWGDLL